MKKGLFFLSTITISLFLFLSCSDKEKEDLLPISNSIIPGQCSVTSFTANISGTLSGVDKVDLALGKRGVLYCEKTDDVEPIFRGWLDGNDNAGCNVFDKSVVSGETMQCSIDGLSEDTEYSYCLFLQKKDGSREISSISSFKTKPFSPEFKELTLNGIHCFIAFADGEIVINEKDVSCCEMGVLVSDQRNCNIDNSTVFKCNTTLFRVRMNSLEPNKDYYCRLYVKYPSFLGQPGYMYGPEKEFKTIKFEDVAVDLGLPSGTLWAAYNVGAERPEEFGDYFSWAEVEPKSTYNWSSYKWQNNDKYNCDTTSNKVSSFKYIELADDAANYNWGSNWRMPSLADSDEIWEYCSFYVDTINGVTVTRIVSLINDNDICIPFGGFKHEKDSHDVGKQGTFWLRDLYFWNYEYGNWRWWWYVGEKPESDIAAWDGLNIRAVYPK